MGQPTRPSPRLTYPSRNIPFAALAASKIVGLEIELQAKDDLGKDSPPFLTIVSRERCVCVCVCSLVTDLHFHAVIKYRIFHYIPNCVQFMNDPSKQGRAAFARGRGFGGK